MKPLKLTIELVPKTSWYTNVRSEVTTEQWDIIRRRVYQAAMYKCEICGENGFDQGFKHQVECHEVWEYDDTRHIQKLTGMIALCPHCHKVKHAGLASMRGELDIVLDKLAKVNGITPDEARLYFEQCMDTWRKRSDHNWHVDTKALKSYIQ